MLNLFLLLFLSDPSSNNNINIKKYCKITTQKKANNQNRDQIKMNKTFILIELFYECYWVICATLHHYLLSRFFMWALGAVPREISNHQLCRRRRRREKRKNILLQASTFFFHHFITELPSPPQSVYNPSLLFFS